MAMFRLKCLTPKSQLVLERIKEHTDIYFDDEQSQVWRKRCITRMWKIYFKYRKFEK